MSCLKYIENAENSTHKPPRFDIFLLFAPLYQFPRAAITSYHKLHGLKKQKFILSQFCIPEVQNQDVSRVGSFWRLRGRIFSIPSLVAASNPWRSSMCLLPFSPLLRVQSALRVHGFCIHRFNQLQMENIQKKISRKFQKGKLNLSYSCNYIHNIYIVFTTIYI